jgi:hypothetical protein
MAEAIQTTEIQAVQAAQVARPANMGMAVTPGFSSFEGFNLIQRMATMFCSSSLVPEQYRGKENLGNCVIALNMAQRMDADPLMVMQNLYVVYGNPGWSSKFLIAMFNQCGRYTSIKYRETGKKGTDTQGVVAYATEKLTGETIEGPEVTIAIAKAEGWYGKNGSKWKTMPDQMLRYRAAAWMIRTTAPELSMGLQTTEEIIDVTPDPIEKAKSEIKESANKEVFAPVPEPKAVPEVKKEAVTALPVTQEVEASPAPKATAKATAKAAPKAEAAPVGPGF